MLRELAPKGLFYLNYFLAEIALVTGKSKKSRFDGKNREFYPCRPVAYAPITAPICVAPARRTLGALSGLFGGRD